MTALVNGNAVLFLFNWRWTDNAKTRDNLAIATGHNDRSALSSHSSIAAASTRVAPVEPAFRTTSV